MEGSCPVLFEGRECGSLRAYERGCLTVFEAEASGPGRRGAPLGLRRRREGYLGVSRPQGRGASRSGGASRVLPCGAFRRGWSTPHRPGPGPPTPSPSRKRPPRSRNVSRSLRLSRRTALSGTARGTARSRRTTAAAACCPSRGRRARPGLGRGRGKVHKRAQIRCLSVVKMVK